MENPEDRYVKVGEINTRYWVLGRGSPLLLIHGLGASCEYWRYNVRALSQAFRVYAFDLPGFGRSDKRIEDLSLDLAGEFVAAFLNAQGVDRASLVGNSLGGAVSLQFAVQYPHRLEKLVLVSSGGLGRELGLSFRLLKIPFLGELMAWKWGTRPGMRLTLRSIVYEPQAMTDEFVDQMAELARLPGLRRCSSQWPGWGSTSEAKTWGPCNPSYVEFRRSRPPLSLSGALKTPSSPYPTPIWLIR